MFKGVPRGKSNSLLPLGNAVICFGSGEVSLTGI